MTKKYFGWIVLIFIWLVSLVWLLPTLISAKDNIAVISGIIFVPVVIYASIVSIKYLIKKEENNCE